MIKEQALKYLGYHHQDIPNSFHHLYDECEKEVKEYSNFKVVYKVLALSDDLMIDELNIKMDFEDTRFYLKGCHQMMLIAATLGVSLERRLKYMQKIDMSKAVIMDAIASSYLEYCLDEYEKILDIKNRTFRFAPGYGDVPLYLNKPFAKYLDIYKHLGVTLSDHYLFIPQKSMLGFIGIGKSQKSRQCGHCIRKKKCLLRKENKRCWID